PLAGASTSAAWQSSSPRWESLCGPRIFSSISLLPPSRLGPSSNASPAWSPDGSEIIYSSDERGGPQLYRISAAGGMGRLVPTGYGYCTEPSWSPDGKKVAFTVRQGGFAIAVMDLATGSARIVAEGQDPSWGADSRHIIYSDGSSIILLDTIKGRRTPVISGLAKVSEPYWSR
ncbi:MAG: hypothetical protein ACKOEZ_05315, partial [Spartobacteria bacterium]